MSLRQVVDHIPGMGCACHAYSSYECGCDVDWTSKNERYLEWKLTMYSYLVREWFLEFRENSVTKQTTAELSKFGQVLNEPLNVEGKLNPLLEPWLNVEVEWRA